jgi:TolB-like protein
MKNLLILMLGLCWFILFPQQLTGQHLQREPARASGQTSHQEIRQGIELYKQNDYQQAEKIFLRVLKNNPNNLLAKEMLAGIYYRTQDLKQAQLYAIMCLRQHRKSAHALMVLSWAMDYKGKKLAARDLLAKAERLADNELVKDEIQKLKAAFHAEMTSPPAAAVAESKDLLREEKPALAVFAFEENDDALAERKLGGIISDMMVTALSKGNRYRLYERAQLDKVLDEQALNQSGAVEPQTAVEVGKLIGVNVILVGSIGMLNDRFELDARIIEAVSGEVRQAANSSVDDEEKLREAVNELAKKLTGD